LQIAQNFTADAERLKQVVSGVKLASVNPKRGNHSGRRRRLEPSAVALTALTSLSTAAEAQFGQRDLLLALRGLAKGLAAVPAARSWCCSPKASR